VICKTYLQLLLDFIYLGPWQELCCVAITM
jgi:hypothetical protein